MMRWTCAVILSLSVSLMHANAQTPVELIDKAIKAYGGEENLKKMQTVSTKAKGKMDFGTISGEFEQEAVASTGGRIRNVMRIKIMGQNLSQVVVFDGQKGWVSLNGSTMDMDENVRKQIEEDIYVSRLSQLSQLKDKELYELVAGPETKVADKPAVGVTVKDKKKVHKDVTLYFERASGLITKTERQAMNPLTMKDAVEERIILEHKTIDGIPTASKLMAKFDGKEFMSAEVGEVKYLASVDDSEFRKP